MSDPRYAGESREFGDSSYVDALVLAGLVMSALIALVVLKFLLNGLVDLLILGDYGSIRRSLGSVIRIVCPWWHPRTQPEESVEQNNPSSEMGGAAFRRRPEVERKAILASILPIKVRKTCLNHSSLKAPR
jgi:hypothetical protein